MDVVERVFGLSNYDASLLAYVLEAAVTVVSKLDFRDTVRLLFRTRCLVMDPGVQVLRLLVKLFDSLPSPDHFSMSQCYIYLNDSTLAASLLNDLLSATKSASPETDRLLIAYQIAFDLADTATQEFLGNVSAGLGGEAKTSDTAMETDEPVTADHTSTIKRILSGEESIKLYLEFLYRNNRADLLILKNTKVRIASSLLTLEVNP